MSFFQVDFQPIGRRGACDSEESLLDAARQFGVDLINFCGGKGVCNRCKVQVIEGETSELTQVERRALTEAEIHTGYRLACMTFPRSDCKIRVPAESLTTPMRTQIEGLETDVEVRAVVRATPITLQPPSLEAPKADAESLLQALNQNTHRFDLPVLQHLSSDLRAWNWHCRVNERDNEVIAVTAPDSRPLGFAVDLGSTKIAGYLVYLETGEVLNSRGQMNPQISYGEDIVSRITYAMKSREAAARMQSVVVEGLNELATQMCQSANAVCGHILDVVIVGNTAMHHLLLGLPVAQLASAPFVPTAISAMDVKAREIGLRLAPGAYVHLLPNIAGYVGGDHVAMLLATAHLWEGNTALVLDIGTNTEISLVTAAGDIRCLSCASGPAFEGYHIADGMRARPGAIESIRVTADEVLYATIEDEPAVGICGSGIIDAVAQMNLAGVLSPNGRIQLGSHPAVSEADGERQFTLVPAEPGKKQRGVAITQDDVREIQLAKASIQTGINVLLQESGIKAEDLDQIIIAGAFGSFIDIPNTLATGMLPDIPLDRFNQVGNAAGIGARMALLSASQRAAARELGHRLEYIELATYPEFSRRFARACTLTRQIS
jgi:uncharacterized 2Fe-2S/4Fe-4S cluster protein (DUF4445 family)